MNPPNNINDTSLIPLSPSTPAHGNKSVFSPTPLGSFGLGTCGMWQVMAAVLENITAIQNYNSEGLMPLSTAIENTNEQNATYWLDIMSGLGTDHYNPSQGQPTYDPSMSDQDNIRNVIAWLQAGGDASTASSLMQEDTTEFNTHNTLYSQANTFWSGINNGLNQSSSDTSQTIQVDLQLYGQGPGTQMQTLAQLI